MGHIVCRWLMEKSGAQDLNDITFAKKIINEAYIEAMKTFQTTEAFKSLKELRQEICEHARKYNMSECLADTVADYETNCVAAALLSRETWRRLKKESVK